MAIHTADGVPGLSKFTREQLAALASPEEVEELFRLYHDLFTTGSSEFEPVLPNDLDACGLTLRDASTVDLGVEVEAFMSPEQLVSKLGFKDARPFQFNKYRHRSGAVPWDAGSEALFSVGPSNDALQEIALHWHQLAGVHAIVRNVFKAEPSQARCAGVLCADEVGLGKTALAIAFLAFLSNTIWHKNKGRPPPPILGLFHYLSADFLLTFTQ